MQEQEMRCVRDVLTVDEILEMLANGMTQVEIARTHGFADNTIHSFLNRRGHTVERINPHRGKRLKIRQLRLKHGLTQKDVADAVGFTQQSVGQHELGRKFPTVEHLEAYADFYGVEVGKLFSESEVK